MKCKVCGTFVEDNDALFCSTCGAHIEPGTRVTLVSGVGTEPSSAGKPTIIMQNNYAQPFPTDSSSNIPQPPTVYTPPYIPQSTYHPVPPSTSDTARLSFILGALAWMVMPIIGALGAVIAGHIARDEIRASGGQLRGDRLALAGLILGYLQLVPLAIGICLFILFMIALIFAA